MGNTSMNKVLPAIDMLLVLVVILFSTAGLVRSLPPEQPEEEQKEYKRLKDELVSKEGLANDLQQQLQVLNECSSTSLEKLKATLTEAEARQQQHAKNEKDFSEVRGKLGQLRDRLNAQKMPEFMKNQIEALKQKMQKLERVKEALEKAVTETDRNRAKAQKLKEKIETLQEEIKRLKAKIKELEEQGKAYPPDDPSIFGGEYKGPYVPLECDDKGVVVYPDKKRVPLEASGDEIEWLKQQIRAVGAANLFVRPSGFEESYTKFYEVLTVFADKEEAKGRTIILSFSPIEAEEAIEKHLRKEDKR